MTNTPKQTLSETLQQALELAKSFGADAADAVIVEGTSTSVSVRMGKLENLERSEGADLGLRVFCGKQQAMVSSSDLSYDAIKQLAERAVDMAKIAPEDPYCGLESRAAINESHFADLDLFDNETPTAEDLEDAAMRAEDVARAVDGVINSDGAGASHSSGGIAIATSAGFSGSYKSGSHSLSCSVVAGSNDDMERDYEYTSAHHLSDLMSAEDVGRIAAERATKRVNARKVETCRVPIVFAPRVANTLLGHLSGAINGAAIARGTSFLKDKMNESIFPSSINIVDDPTRLRGLRSKPFDGEGVVGKPLKLVEGGILKEWLLASASARQLGLESNGRASRGTSSPPSPSATNLYMEAGSITPDDLIGDIENGLYITELIGMGVNGVTGDYSRGAAGFWIEKGQIAYPVSELTVAGNLVEMFTMMTPASDLEFRYGTDAPTVRIDEMMVAGS